MYNIHIHTYISECIRKVRLGQRLPSRISQEKSINLRFFPLTYFTFRFISVRRHLRRRPQDTPTLVGNSCVWFSIKVG